MEKYCVSLDLAKRMKESGFPQDTEFYWYDVDGKPTLLDNTDWQAIGFSKSYDQIIAEVKKCKDAGLEPMFLYRAYEVTTVQCVTAEALKKWDN